MVSKLRAKTRGKPTADQKLKNRLRYATGPKIEQRLNKELYNKSLLRQLGLPLEVLGTKVVKIAESRLKHMLEKKKEKKQKKKP